MFGFTVYSSYTQAAATGKIPLPTADGKIWVDSEAGKGSTFSFSMQVKVCEEQD